MKLANLLKNIDNYKVINFNNFRVNNIVDYSRDVKSGDMFVAIKGKRYDGHRFVNQVVKKGADVIVISDEERNLVEKFASYDGCFIIVDNIRKFLSKILPKFYGIPSKDFSILGITGTNGKTTTCNLLYYILASQNKKVGIFDTIKFNTGFKTGNSLLTSPDVFTMHRGLKEMYEAGCSAALIEISSHGIAQYRIDPSRLCIGVLTNITQDHLDYHKTMQNYISTKLKLFQGLNKSAFAILNKDIKLFEDFLKATKASVFTYGIKKQADFTATEIQDDISGSKFKLVYPSGTVNMTTSLVGIYNIYNILAALSAAYLLGIDPKDLVKAVKNFKTVPGRLQLVDCDKSFKVFVDYAHTPDALENVLKTLRNNTSGSLILVFGCGGDRDKKKRPIMGRIASLYSDFFIITNDNSRTEDPKQIVDDIKKGIPSGKDNFEVIFNRKKAINTAIKKAGGNDIILIAGKGHEKYQIIDGDKLFFDDVLVAENILKEKK